MSDADLAAINRWGIVNQDRPIVPHPAAVVVDADGVVRYFRLDVDYKERPLAAELLDAVDRLIESNAALP